MIQPTKSARLVTWTLLTLVGVTTVLVHEPNATTGVTTLYYHDPDRWAMSLSQADLFDKETAPMELSYGHFMASSLTVAGTGSRRGSLVDLGDHGELSEMYGLPTELIGTHAYSSIRIVNGQLVIGREGEEQPLRQRRGLFGRASSGVSRVVAPGHIYLMRLLDTKDPNFELVAKLIVLEHELNETVTLRWEILTRGS